MFFKEGDNLLVFCVYDIKEDNEEFIILYIN